MCLSGECGAGDKGKSLGKEWIYRLIISNDVIIELSW